MAQITLITDKEFKAKAIPEIDNIAQQTGSTRAAIIRSALVRWFKYNPKPKPKQWYAGIRHEEAQWEQAHESSIRVNVDQQLKDLVNNHCFQYNLKPNSFLRDIVYQALNIG